MHYRRPQFFDERFACRIENDFRLGVMMTFGGDAYLEMIPAFFQRQIGKNYSIARFMLRLNMFAIHQQFHPRITLRIERQRRHIGFGK